MTSSKIETKRFDWTDPLDLAARLTEEERMISESARSYAREKLLPRIVSAFADERFDREVLSEMGELGLLGITLPEDYGGSDAGHVAYGLVTREIEAVDSGYRSAMSVQSSLVMYPILAFGSEEQKQKYLPKMARGEIIGCFGLTEADGGSDPASMRTKAEKVDGGYVLNGSKYWISNSPVADVALVWAKLDGDITGFLVERGAKGSPPTRSATSCRSAPRSPATSAWPTPSCPTRPGCPACAACAARSPASTRRATGSLGARSARPSSASTPRATT